MSIASARLPTVLVASIVSFVLLASAIASGPAPATGPLRVSAASGELHVGFLQAVDSLNPFRGITDSSSVLYGLLYDYLFSLDQDGNFVPNIALGATCDATCRNWTYAVRQGVHWSDGTNLTADDVAFTINYNIQNFFQLWAFEPYVNRVVQCTAATRPYCGAVVTSPWNVTVYFDRPFAAGRALFVPILQAAQWSPISPNAAQTSYANPTPIGTGPFIADPNLYTEWQTGQPLHLLRNPTYHPVGSRVGPAILSDIYLQQFADENTLVAAVQAGVIDLAKLTSAGYGALQGASNVGRQEGLLATQYWNMIGFSQIDTSAANGRLNPARWDQNVRQALAMATNKDFILNTIYGGHGVRGTDLMSPITPQWWYDPVADGTNLTFNIAAANDLLNRSGYNTWSGGSFGQGIRMASHDITFTLTTGACGCPNPTPTTKTVPAGTPLYFTMAARQEFPQEIQTALYLRAQWAQVGVNATIKVELETALANDVYGGYVESYIWFWSGDPDPNYLLSIESGYTLDGWNDNYWNNVTYNQLYVAQLAALNVSLRAYDVRQAERVHYVSAVYLTYIYPFGEWAYRTDHFMNWGDWTAHPYRQMDAFWGANPLFLELAPAGVSNNPPSTPTITGPSSLSVGQFGAFVGSSVDPDPNETLTWTWSWGDGTSTVYQTTSAVTAVNATHAWTAPGFVSVTLTVSDGALSATSSPFSIEVFGVSITGALARPGDTVTLYGTILEATKGRWSVTFGDGASTSGTFTAGLTSIGVSHVYSSQGTYTATLTAKMGSTTDRATSTVIIDGTPPVLLLPSSLTVEATGNMTPVFYPVNATDNVGLAGPPSCTPPPGSSFPLGTTPVSCQVTDLVGFTTTGAFPLTVRDTTPPSLSVPPSIVAEATSPAGAAVNYTVSAFDAVGVASGPTCVPASGSLFALDTLTTVACAATDTSGNVGRASFTVSVVDTVPPAIVAPVNLTAEATSPAGAVVTFAVSAFDAVGIASGPICTPASGSQFPLGLTLVQCTATDTSGNIGNATISVVVRDSTPPVTSITSAVDGNGFAIASGGVTPSSSASFSFSGTDAVGVVGFVCSLDGAPFSSCVSGVTYTGLGLGSHVFQVAAVDAAGNMNPATVRWSVLTPMQTVQDLIAKVNALKASGVLTTKQANALLSPLNKAYNDLSAGHVSTAIKDLKLFNATVAQDIAAGILPPATGIALQNEACDLILVLGGTC